jgi:hypothetical protein
MTQSPETDAELSVGYVLIPRMAELTGYSKRAIEIKIARGQWREGIEWRKAPDGHRMISLDGFRAWVERGR